MSQLTEKNTIPREVRAVDCHCHLSSPQFDSDRDIVLNTCSVKGILLVDSALSVRELTLSLTLASRNPWFKTSAGWDPVNLDESAALEMCQAIEQASDRIIAIGEIGLDRFKVRDRLQWARQEKITGMFLELSERTGKPLVIHSRSAGQACIELLEKNGYRNVLMHAFDGSSSTALRGESLGFIFSVPPSIARSEQKVKMVRRLALGSLVLESDAPALGVVRGERNTPESVMASASKIAETKRLGFDTVLSQTTEKALSFYGLSRAAT
ncbi:MAG: TatD family hydrolase [Thermoprotei archaeon]